MKKVWLLVLLVSLGLNLGLGWRLLQDRDGTRISAPTEYGPGSRAGSSNGKKAGSDTTAWREFASKRLDRLARHLDLTVEQKAMFAQTRSEVGGRMMSRRGEIQVARAELLELVLLDSTPSETLRTSFRELAGKQAEIDSAITEVLLRELEILDPDQRKKYLEMLPMNQRGHPGMRGRGRGRRAAD